MLPHPHYTFYSQLLKEPINDNNIEQKIEDVQLLISQILFATHDVCRISQLEDYRLQIYAINTERLLDIFRTASTYYEEIDNPFTNLIVQLRNCEEKLKIDIPYDENATLEELASDTRANQNKIKIFQHFLRIIYGFEVEDLLQALHFEESHLFITLQLRLGPVLSYSDILENKYLLLDSEEQEERAIHIYRQVAGSYYPNLETKNLCLIALLPNIKMMLKGFPLVDKVQEQWYDDFKIRIKLKKGLQVKQSWWQKLLGNGRVNKQENNYSTFCEYLYQHIQHSEELISMLIFL